MQHIQEQQAADQEEDDDGNGEDTDDDEDTSDQLVQFMWGNGIFFYFYCFAWM